MPAFDVPANFAFDTYDELVAAINDWMDRGDLTGVAPQMIALAEDEISVEVEPLFEELVDIITVINGSGRLPEDVAHIRRVVSDGLILQNYGQRSARLLEADSTLKGYSIEGDSIYLWPVRDALVAVHYQPKLRRLSPDTPNSDLMNRFPSLYFYAAMTFAEGYVANDPRAAVFRNLFENMLEKVRKYYLRQRHPGPLAPLIRNMP